MARFVMAAHGVFAIVVHTKPKKWVVRSRKWLFAVKRIGDCRKAGPRITGGVGGNSSMSAKVGSVVTPLKGGIVDQPVAECDVVDQRSGLVSDRIKIAQAHVEVDLCAGGIGEWSECQTNNDKDFPDQDG